MKHTLHDIELIERYFDNNLTETENDQMQDRLNKDMEFQKLFTQEKLLINTIRSQAAQKNLNYLKEIEHSFNQPTLRYFKENWYYFAAAACIALIALVVIWPQHKDTPEDLYAAYFKPHPNVFEPSLRSTGDVTARKQAFQAYEQGDYQRASLLLSALIKENKEPGMLMLLGNSNLVLGKTAESKQNFMDLITNYDDLDLQAKWYLSLCYLRNGEIEPTRKLLKEIVNTDFEYSSKADELLKKLD